MGVVYRATDRLTGENVALKRVTVPGQQLQFASRVSLGQSDNFRLALAQEFKTLASLRHPHIISVLDYGFDAQRQPFLTMELLEDAPNLELQAGYGTDNAREFKAMGSTPIIADKLFIGGGIASLRHDAQGKAYAQMLLDHPVSVHKVLLEHFRTGIEF